MSYFFKIFLPSLVFLFLSVKYSNSSVLDNHVPTSFFNIEPEFGDKYSYTITHDSKPSQDQAGGLLAENSELYPRRIVTPSAPVSQKRRKQKPKKEEKTLLEKFEDLLGTIPRVEESDANLNQEPSYYHRSENPERVQQILQNIRETIFGSSSPESETRSGESEAYTPNQVIELLHILSKFDNQTCFEKVFCDIHFRAAGQDQTTLDQTFSFYELKVLSMFKVLRKAYEENLIKLDAVTKKYLKSARKGRRHLSTCEEIYSDCPDSTEDLIADMESV